MALTEQEILDQLKQSLGAAVSDLERLAQGERGVVYRRCRENMKLIEGCCRQMAQWREDARWLPWAFKIEQAHQKCGEWLRVRSPGWRFQGLAEILRGWAGTLHEIETKAIGKRGPILPAPLEAPHRDTRPVAVSNVIKPKKSKLIIPPGVSVH